MTINAGSRDELSTEHGIAHFVEHTLFKGTARRRAWQVNCRLENLGGELNAFTTKEETVVHATVMKCDYARAVELIQDIVFNSTFPEREVEKERQVIQDEINLYKDSPSERIYDEFEEMLFSGSPLGHNILGTRTSLRKLSAAQLRRFVERTYNTDQMVFSMIGNVSEQAFVETMERWFGDIPARRRQFERTPVNAPVRFDKSTGRSTHQFHCIMGSEGYSLESPKRLPLMLLTGILGGPWANSLLNLSLREKNALSYGVEAAYTPYTDTGIATIYFTCERDKGEKCMELVDRQLYELRERPVTPRRLSIAKKQFLGQFAVVAENGENYMLSAGKSYLVYGSVESLPQVRERISAITAAELQDVATEIFTDMSTLTYK
jgi:predicted Zn-dependent peptidase